jgi:hypothetical protein
MVTHNIFRRIDMLQNNQSSPSTEHQQQQQEGHLPSDVLVRLSSELQDWRRQAAAAGGMPSDEAFRYEMLARRLIAAEYGRPDAVEWALNWFQDLFASDAEAKMASVEKFAVQRDIAFAQRAEIAAGRSSNPIFQAFLDTLETPEAELYRGDGSFQGWKYLCWVGPLIGQFERLIAGQKIDQSERLSRWQLFVAESAAKQLAVRVLSARNKA